MVKPAEVTVAVAHVAATSESEAKAFVYEHESGNDPSARNGGGCYGLGQDCFGIVEPICGTNYACQDRWFSGYMERRYGTWVKAKQHWIARVPIDGQDVGNWW